MKSDLKNFNFDQLADYLKKINQPKYRAQQIFSWMYQKGVSDFSLMLNLSKAFTKEIEQDCFISTLSVKERFSSRDGTKKYLFALDDGHTIESVLIPFQERNTVCVSTQVGCKYACEFCASGKLGFIRNLTQSEILNQIGFIKNELKGKRISNIVFMGIGEPFDNYDNVLHSIDIINSPYGFNIGQRKITISTAGVIDGIKRLGREGLQVELSISLHSADEKKRSSIMPINRKYPLTKLKPVLKEFIKLTKRKITFEYMLLGGFNVGEDDAERLVSYIRGLHCCVNLIPCNPVSKSQFKQPDKLEALFFKDYLIKNKVEVTIRKPRGQDIQAACGQLRLRDIDSRL
ncbi:23S rRNA (adenine(2503)-C(2))-methyltransferase RlmN [Thermoproteota archaeon]